MAPAGHALHRRRAGLPSPAASPAPCTPSHDIRIENFRDTKLPEGRIDAVIGNLPFADVKLDYRGQQAAAARFLHRQVARRPEARRHPGPGHQPLHARQAERRRPRVPGRAGRFPGRDPPAVATPSSAKARAVVTDILFLRKRAPGEPAHHADPAWLDTAPLAIDGADIPINRYFLQPSRDGAGHLEPQGPALRRRLQRRVDRRPGRAARRRHPPPARGRRLRRRQRREQRSRPPPPSRRRRSSGTSPRAASSSATTGSSTRSRTARPCRSPTAARCSRPTAR